MMIYTRQALLSASPAQVFRCCTSRRGFCRQFPFEVRWLSGPEQWQVGDVLDFRYRVGGVWLRHRAQVVQYEPDRLFVDRMLAGPFRHFCHVHRFEPCQQGTCVIDVVEFSVGLGRLVDQVMAATVLDRTFSRRHWALMAMQAELTSMGG